MNSVLKTRAELAGRSVEAILRPMAYQTLECDRRGGLAARERREELSDPVPVLCDPIEVTRNLLAYKFARFWALPYVPQTRQGHHLSPGSMGQEPWIGRRGCSKHGRAAEPGTPDQGLQPPQAGFFQGVVAALGS